MCKLCYWEHIDLCMSVIVFVYDRVGIFSFRMNMQKRKRQRKRRRSKYKKLKRHQKNSNKRSCRRLISRLQKWRWGKKTMSGKDFGYICLCIMMNVCSTFFSVSEQKYFKVDWFFHFLKHQLLAAHEQKKVLKKRQKVLQKQLQRLRLKTLIPGDQGPIDESEKHVFSLSRLGEVSIEMYCVSKWICQGSLLMISKIYQEVYIYWFMILFIGNIGITSVSWYVWNISWVICFRPDLSRYSGFVFFHYRCVVLMMW